MEKITIVLNGEKKELKTQISIKTLIEKLGLDVKKIAIEKNYEIVPVEDFEKNILCDKDQIEIVHFIGGG